MKYNELKEMEVKDWDGKPFEAYYTDDPDRIVDGATTGILGYVEGKWFSGARWNHVYPVEWNKEKVEEALNPKPKRMTKRQLAMWLAKGNGEWKLKSGCRSFIAFDYNGDDSSELVGRNVEVRKWDSKEWVEPTIDLLEGC